MFKILLVLCAMVYCLGKIPSEAAKMIEPEFEGIANRNEFEYKMIFGEALLNEISKQLDAVEKEKGVSGLGLIMPIPIPIVSVKTNPPQPTPVPPSNPKPPPVPDEVRHSAPVSSEGPDYDPNVPEPVVTKKWALDKKAQQFDVIVRS